MFAVRRTAKVRGRIIFLVVSIKTMNGIRRGGVPWGTKWLNIFCVCCDQPNNMNAIHRGRLSDSLIVKWAVLVKI